MTSVVLTKLAREDLISIAQYGDENFGTKQSDRYRDLLTQQFTKLANHPEMYPAVDYIRTGYRRCICGAHSIYFKVETDRVVIVRVLGQQDTSKAL